MRTIFGDSFSPNLVTTSRKSTPPGRRWAPAMRGDIYRLRDNAEARGHEQRDGRYAVVLQSDALLSSTLIAAPTSRSARSTSYRPEIEIAGTPARVLVEQLQAVEPEKRFGQHVGRLSAEERARVDDALRLVTGLLG